jgi:mRNA interferase MazF
VTFEAFDVVIVPFPFTDADRAKRRPALVVSDGSFGAAAGHSVMAMITSAEGPVWPLDVSISDLTAAGLPKPCVVRMKLFTLDHRLVLRKAGALARADRRRVNDAFQQLLPST